MAVQYRPKHQRQLAEPISGRYDCTAYSAALAVDRHTIGGVVVRGRDIRLASTEPRPDPGSPGLNLAQATAAAFRLTRVNLTVKRGPWATFVTRLRTRGAILPGDYDQMGEFSAQPSFRDLHAMFINNLNSDHIEIGGVTYGPEKAGLTYDPLYRTFRWVPLAVLRKYAEKYARAVNYTGGVIYAETRVTPLIAAQIN